MGVNTFSALTESDPELSGRNTIDSSHDRRKVNLMYVNTQALLSLIAGILILIRPALLNYIIAIYLIIVGVLGLVR